VSTEAIAEVEWNLVEDFPHLDPASLRRRVGQMQAALEDNLLGPGSLDEVPDAINPKDRQVIADALAGEASVIVTNDRRLRAETRSGPNCAPGSRTSSRQSSSALRSGILTANRQGTSSSVAGSAPSSNARNSSLVIDGSLGRSFSRSLRRARQSSISALLGTVAMRSIYRTTKLPSGVQRSCQIGSPAPSRRRQVRSGLRHEGCSRRSGERLHLLVGRFRKPPLTHGGELQRGPHVLNR
jgi:hypothetical protein